MPAFVVDSVAPRTRHGFAGLPDREGFEAKMTFEDGSVVFFSRLEGEQHWVADAHFGPNSYPHWCHSFGERTTAARVATDALAAALDEALAAREGV